MGIWKSLFGTGRVSKDDLIRDLVKRRARSNSMPAAMGFDEAMIDSFDEILLAGLPESTIAAIIETYASLRAQGFSEEQILVAIEAYRSQVGTDELPNPLTLDSYIRYRLAIEHAHGARIPEAFVEEAIRIFRKHYKI